MSLQHLGLDHPPLEQGRYDFGPVPISLGLGDAAKTLLIDPQPSLYDYRAEAAGELKLDSGYHRQLVLADIVLGPRLRVTECLSDDSKELERNPACSAQLPEGGVAESRESVERTLIEEGEGESSVSDCFGHVFEGHTGPLEVVDPTAPYARHPMRTRLL